MGSRAVDAAGGSAQCGPALDDRLDPDEAAGAAADDLTAELTALLARLGALAADARPGGDAARIDRIAMMERIRAALAAAQHTEMVAFARSQVEQQIADDTLDPRTVGRGIGDQIGLACQLSRSSGPAASESPAPCTPICPPPAPCWRPDRSAKTSPPSSCPTPAT